MDLGHGYWCGIPWGLIQLYWIIWLVLSFIVSYVLGAVTLRHWENLKES